MTAPAYCGRLAPSPTGYLHLGHARTFWIAAERARRAGGTLRLRSDDLDLARRRPEFVAAMQEDLRWLGLAWDGPMIAQSERLPLYREALDRLRRAGAIYPCHCSRRDVLAAALAPHEGETGDEPLYPGTCRPADRAARPADEGANWRFRVPDGETLAWQDGAAGEQRAVAGRDFGDFLVWRKDGIPSYQLACAVDDTALGVTEAVRGLDLLRSTFRQLLLFRALGETPPRFYHCPLVTDAQGRRLAKRDAALSLRALRARGVKPEAIVRDFGL